MLLSVTQVVANSFKLGDGGVMQMSPLLQASPEKRRSLAQKYEARSQQYGGFCMAGQADGRGEWGVQNGDLFVGDWRKGLRHGRGTFKCPDGRAYVGEYEAGRRHGQGIITLPAGKDMRGVGVTGFVMDRAATQDRIVPMWGNGKETAVMGRAP
jgi:hypothetical protein